VKSLRRGLTVWLWTAVGVVALLSLAVGNWQAAQQTQRQLDYQMQQVAQILAAQDFSAQRRAPPAEPLNLSPTVHISHDSDDDLLVTVRNSAGTLLYASNSNHQLPDKVLPSFGFLGFRTVDIGDESYRVFVAHAGELQIQVAQSMEAIREAEGGIALATLLPIAILLPVLAVVIGLAIRRQLQPLNDTARTIAERPPLSFDLLPEEAMPVEVRPLVEEINRLLRRLQMAVEREQRFVTDAAHALRTPLTALQLQAEILDGGKDPAERITRLTELRSGIRRLIRLSEQLLSLARSETETGLTDVTTALDPMLAELAMIYADTARARGIDLKVEADTHAYVPGNTRRLTLIFGNLVDNSLRYTPSGGRIRIRASTANSHVRVEVWDEGPGVPPQDLERVFERFYRGSAEQDIGSGLGLATVRALTEQLGGTVLLENRVDNPGLVAIVTLPLAGTDETGLQAPHRRSA
jgi:two-component system, OmpR family, sensor kinase